MFAKAVVCVAVLASSSVFAQGKTRAEAYQELVEAQHNGLNYVTDTSYPDVNPMLAPQVARMKHTGCVSAVVSVSAAVDGLEVNPQLLWHINTTQSGVETRQQYSLLPCST